MKKPDWRITILFVCVFLLALLATAPASLLSSLLAGLSHDRLVLANAEGTVWRGSAVPAIRGSDGNLLALERLGWDIQLLQLLKGQLAVQLRWDNMPQAQPMQVKATYAQVELRDAVLPVSAGMLSEFVPLLKPVQLSGPVRISSPSFIITRQGMHGSATADWMNAASVLSAVKPLGQYQLSLAGSGTQVDVTLRTVSGTLLLDGNGSFSATQGLRFQGTARAAAESKGRLDELLGNFGPESAPGVHTLSVMR